MSVAPGDIAVGVVIGRASEYFDFFVYAIASVLVFPDVFFPTADRWHGTLYAFAILAMAFVVRPLGTWAGMAIQRRFDRGTKLTVALFLLGCSTVGVAWLPTADSVEPGVAVGLLLLCRIGQGLALGGSWDGLPSLLALNAPESRRGWYAMLGQMGAPLGFVLACGLFVILWTSLSPVDFLSWGWRYPFFAAFAINVVGLFARLRLVLTHEYERELQAHELDPCDTSDLLRHQGHNVVIGALAAVSSYALFHLVTVFPLCWVVLHAPQNVGSFLLIELLGSMFFAAAMPVSGFLADRLGRRRLLAMLAVLIAAFSVVAPWLLDGGRSGQAAYLLTGFVLLGLSYAQSSGTVTSNFLSRFRYTGAALTADLAWLMGAAFAPMIALALSTRFGLGSITIYLVSGALVTLLALRLNRTLASGS
jgi:MFS family permease